MSDHATPEILCLGEPMVEFVRTGALNNDTYRAGVGGDTSNAAISAARQGGKVGYLTALGQDRFGDRIVELWAREGVDTSTVIRNPDAPTAVYFIDPDPAERHFTYYRKGSAASRYRSRDLPEAQLAQARVLHLSGITLAVSQDLRSAAFDAIEQVHAAGGTVSLDTNLRLKLWDIDTARQVTEQAARQADIVITSTEDGAALVGTSDPMILTQHYADLGCSIVIVTRGAEGALIRSEAETREIPSAPATPVDSTGAGDSFAGAFLAWWLETGDVWRAAACASITAAGTVSGLGAVEPIPRRTEVLQRAERMGV